MIRSIEILLISSVIIILSYLTATLSYNFGLTMLGSIPIAHAHAEDIKQYGIFLDDPTNGDYKNFAEWQTKKIFKLTISELEEK